MGKKKIRADLMVFAAIVVVVILAGCVETSPYSVDFSPIAEPFPKLLVNVSGPADELAIILTNPDGYSDTGYISKRAMIDNFESVKVRMCKGSGNPPVGYYKLVVKTITPEKVVYEAEEKFTPGVISITDAYLKFKKTGGVYRALPYYLDEYSITIKNDGELPIKGDGVLITINDDSIRIPKHIGMPHGENKIEGWGPFYLSNEITSMDLATIELYSGNNKIASFEAEITIEY